MANLKIITNTDPTVDANFPSVTGTTVGTDKHGLDVNIIGSEGSDLAIAWDSTSTANTTYVGYAVIGSATSSALWKIMKVDTSTSRVTWASGDALYTKIWDNRTGLTYT